MRCRRLAYAISPVTLSRRLQVTAQKVSASPPGRVSIYDGVEPSPFLGPKRKKLPETPGFAPVPAPATASALTLPMFSPAPAPVPAPIAPSIPTPVPAPAPAPALVPTPIAIQSSIGLHCGAGCIAGATIGAFLLLLVLPLFLCLCWCHRRRSINDDVMSTATDVELLSNPVYPSRGPNCIPCFRIGDEVFCNEGRNCSFGRIKEVLKEDKYEVAMWDGDSKQVPATMLARNYPEGTQVVYSPPDGRRPQVTGTIIQADGSYWPPFYQLTPHSGHLSLVNTTAECIQELTEDAKPGQGEHFISAKAV